MSASDVINKYIAFFEKRGHKRIPNSPLVPQNDPTTLFTSSGMQPLVPYLLGEVHPQGTRLVNVQNVFRAVDIEEILRSGPREALRIGVGASGLETMREALG